MQIKDVEKLTGLTKKSIRYYESKGLLSVKRDRSNDYRDYTEEDVEVLRKIRLYRFLDFSVEEVGTLLVMTPEEMQEALQEKADWFEKQSIENDIKKSLSLRLMKTGDCSGLYDEVAALDGELENVKSSLLELSYTNVYAAAVSSLILLSPILWLFVNISERKWELLPWNAVFALIASVFLWNVWRDFVKFRNNHKSALQKENRKNRLVLPVMLLSLAACFATLIGMQLFQEECLLVRDYLFFENPFGLTVLLIPAIILAVSLAAARLLHRFKLRGMGAFDNMVDWLQGKKSVLFVGIAAFLLILYCAFTTVNAVTADSVILYRPWNLEGTVFSYEQVQSVDAGFQRNGSFRYTLVLPGEKISFSAPSTNSEIERYKEDTYLELEELDEKLMSLGISKSSDSRFSGRAHLDPYYVNRFLRIVENRN